MVGVCEGECMGCSPGDEPDLDEMPQLYEAFEGWNSVCGQAYNLKGIKGKFYCFSSLKLCFSFVVALFLA